MDNQSAFWSLHPYVYGKTFPAFLFSPATATVGTERKNGNGRTERRNSRTATESWKPGIILYRELIQLLFLSVCVQRKAEFHEHYAAGAVYVLSMAWFREWENFVCCKTDGLLNYQVLQQ